jgi:hypothetical protein
MDVVVATTQGTDEETDMAKEEETTPVFKPGDNVPETGVYSIVHHGHHPKAHEVACVAGRRFPQCRKCGTSVRFRQEITEHAIEEDDLFNPYVAQRTRFLN